MDSKASKPFFQASVLLGIALVRPDHSDLSEAGSRTSRESSSSLSISPSGGSDASRNSSIEAEEDFPTLFVVYLYRISCPEAIPLELDKNNALGILSTSTTLDQFWRQHIHESFQRNDSLAFFVDDWAAGARESSSDMCNRKQKKKTSSRVENAKNLIRAYDRGYRLIG